MAQDEKGSSQEPKEPADADEAAEREAQEDHPREAAQKSYHTVLEQLISQAEEELQRPVLALALSSLSAGLDLGFGPLAMAVLRTKFSGVWPEPTVELGAAALYALGFVFVVLGRSALFTEHTTSAVLPVFAGRASVGQLLRLWGVCYAANLVGAAIIAAAGAWLGPALGVAEPQAFGHIAGKLVHPTSGVLFASAVAAGWLMGLLSWLVTAGRDTVSQTFFVFLATFFIGLLGLHHCIAGTIEVLLGVFSGEGASLAGYGRFLLLATLGNILGGSVFVALLKYGHIRGAARAS
ncbi:formate/nitrite transporter family protein [Aggregicoccus sp. 17bor-14]|uniref:formate/nitrite transporter family protein n=1 Tax=Myxococcaceae TaxID=31 RepID=UPI00129CEBB3|nr:MULTISPECIES: formate/nitrite transporter family protein [Myxococcaceae]MBF5045488.1 formate/nitrite transporter family protein [Simulacricoccus sp. 17bor-14]MRI91226.1 formate/nitrite transporter family protein [Aggregicoccus sp. 17bor-14]